MLVNINKAFEIFKAAIITATDPDDTENIFIPNAGVTDTDREKFFTNYNSDLNRKIVQLKLNN